MSRISRNSPEYRRRPLVRRSTPLPELATNQGAIGALRIIATIGSPLVLGTSLLFYFGWVRAKTQARALGFDSSAMNLPTTEYLLKSIDALYIPLVLLLIAALILNGLHEQFIAAGGRWPRRRKILLILARVLRKSWILWILLGFFLLPFEPVGFFSIPFSITLALLCVIYGRVLLKLVVNVEPWSSTRKLLVFTLLAFVIFWDVERIARNFGEGYAALIVAEPQRLAAVIIYSASSLGISAPGVTENRIDRENSEYHYRYNGLRLLQQSDGKFFLINEKWNSQEGRVFIFRETDNIRIEFAG